MEPYNIKKNSFNMTSKYALEGFETGRVIAEHKGLYIVKTSKGEYESEITGKLRFSAQSREELPVVGDWVALTLFETYLSVIHKIFPRHSLLKREAVGKHGETQIICSNVDYALLVQSIDNNFNLNRLERYLTICNASSISPIIVLTKTDLTERSLLSNYVDRIQCRIGMVPVIPVSNENHDGIEELLSLIIPDMTYCLLGSSGVGKSTLINNLAGKEFMKTDSISQSTNKGRHTTSHRELISLDNGGMLIDNPGMREVGIADAKDGLEKTFDKLTSLTGHCKFSNCSHTTESGCRILDALEKGELEREVYENFMKLERERSFFESTLQERRIKERAFGVMLKNYKKEIKKK